MDDIHPEMTVLEVISSYRETEPVLKAYDGQAGECICCSSLFDTLAEVIRKYGLDREEFMRRIKKAARSSCTPG
ncbi:MAG: hypothetical protein ACLFSY_10695 [Desulfonatronovibrionaceae bacterium]